MAWSVQKLVAAIYKAVSRPGVRPLHECFHWCGVEPSTFISGFSWPELKGPWPAMSHVSLSAKNTSKNAIMPILGRPVELVIPEMDARGPSFKCFTIQISHCNPKISLGLACQTSVRCPNMTDY
jgi:hypothetical protein